jgi:phosphotransferase system enzyme I (PtsI)
MVSTINELRQAKAVLNEVKNKLKKEGIEFKENLPVGIMIEIPSAAIAADILAKEADFFSIGTNDLIQYTMAVDRGNEHVAYLYDPLHPPVLRLVKFVIESAHRAGIPVSMCGEMAGDPVVTSVLLGMGLDEFSMAPSAISQIKNQVRTTKMDDARKIAQDVMEFSTAEEIREYLDKLKK